MHLQIKLELEITTTLLIYVLTSFKGSTNSWILNGLGTECV